MTDATDFKCDRCGQGIIAPKGTCVDCYQRAAESGQQPPARQRIEKAYADGYAQAERDICAWLRAKYTMARQNHGRSFDPRAMCERLKAVLAGNED